jgi:hypothetical protein
MGEKSKITPDGVDLHVEICAELVNPRPSRPAAEMKSDIPPVRRVHKLSVTIQLKP